MRLNLRRAVVATGLVAGLTMVIGPTESYAQGYTYAPGGGYYYAGPGYRGYTYPAYAYTYWTPGRSALPSGYYAYPTGGPYYYQYYAPASAIPAWSAPASRPAPAAATSREAELEARISRLETIIDGLSGGATPAAPSYYPAGGSNIERDSRYPNWSFDYNQQVAHNM
jgi:hypothetical protein